MTPRAAAPYPAGPSAPLLRLIQVFRICWLGWIGAAATGYICEVFKASGLTGSSASGGAPAPAPAPTTPAQAMPYILGGIGMAPAMLLLELLRCAAERPVLVCVCASWMAISGLLTWLTWASWALAAACAMPAVFCGDGMCSGICGGGATREPQLDL